MQSNLIAKLFSVFAADASASVSQQKTTPVELDIASLHEVVGGGPHGGWSASVVVTEGPHGGWQ